MKKQRLEGSWYDFPHYYDLALRGETRREAGFLEAAWRKYCPRPVHRLFEPACGTGRLVVEMAARGYSVVGLDRSRPALDYLHKQLRRRGLSAETIEGDMVDFRLDKRVDAAFCTFNSFRHLTSEAAARGHLQAVARALRPGGIYVLGLHLLPLDADPDCTERWRARSGKTQITVTLRVLSSDRRKRIERLRVSLLVRRPAGELRLRDEFDFRMYTAAQFRRLLAGVPQLRLLDVYDFWYEIDRPQTLDDEMSDTVFILQRA